MSAKRNLALVAILLVVAAALVWTSSRLTWMHVIIADGLSPTRDMNVNGQTWASVLGTVLPLVLLAAVLAAIALKGWMRALVAVVVAASAIGAAFPAVEVLTQDADVRYIEQILKLAPKDYIAQADKGTLGPAIAIVGAVIAVVAATLLMRGLRGGGMGSTKYVSPAARRAELEKRVFDGQAAQEASERDLWDALDGGDDPTEGAETRSPKGER